MRIIPAIDLIDGRCVRLTQGDYSKKTIYNSDPVDVARNFEDVGIKHLHLVDLDGAKTGRVVNWKVLEAINVKTNLIIDFGGGIQSDNDARIAFDSGASQITGGSVAIKQPELFYKWLRSYGAEAVILGADVKDEKVAVNGWQQTSDVLLLDFLERYTQKGVMYTVCTDISKDGMLCGPSTSLYRSIKEQFPELKLISSGGVGKVEDLEDLQELGMEGVIIGKALYENRITLKQLQKYVD